MPSRQFIFAKIALLLCCMLPLMSYSQVATSGDRLSIHLQSLRWMIGSWQASKQANKDKQYIDEHWSLSGESLLGISRTVEGKSSKAFELLLIEPQDGDLIVRLRFFGPAIDKATRGKDEPLRLKVIRADTQQLICEGIGNEVGTTLTYTNIGAERMQAKISKVRDGKIVWQEEYEFQRTTPP